MQPWYAGKMTKTQTGFGGHGIIAPKRICPFYRAELAQLAQPPTPATLSLRPSDLPNVRRRIARPALVSSFNVLQCASAINGAAVQRYLRSMASMTAPSAQIFLGRLVRTHSSRRSRHRVRTKEGGTREGGERIAIRHVSRDELSTPRRSDLSAFNLPAPCPR